MAFKLTKNALGHYEGKVGAVVVIGVLPATTVLSEASYNDQDISPALEGGSATFTIVANKKNLALVVDPPFPPEAWSIVEIDGANTQPLEPEAAGVTADNLIIVGK